MSVLIPLPVRPVKTVVTPWFNWCDVCHAYIEEGAEHFWDAHLSSAEEARELREFKAKAKECS
jgi:hypothetical protein